MPGLGTLVNVLAIIAGGAGGLAFGRLLPERLKDTVLGACGLIVVFLGLAGALSRLLVVTAQGTIGTRGTTMMLASLALGALLGGIDRHRPPLHRPRRMVEGEDRQRP